jgi:hypothetical protein
MLFINPPLTCEIPPCRGKSIHVVWSENGPPPIPDEVCLVMFPPKNAMTFCNTTFRHKPERFFMVSTCINMFQPHVWWVKSMRLTVRRFSCRLCLCRLHLRLGSKDWSNGHPNNTSFKFPTLGFKTSMPSKSLQYRKIYGLKSKHVQHKTLDLGNI